MRVRSHHLVTAVAVAVSAPAWWIASEIVRGIYLGAIFAAYLVALRLTAAPGSHPATVEEIDPWNIHRHLPAWIVGVSLALAAFAIIRASV